MKKEDIVVLIIGILLLAGMLYTLFFGGTESRHGTGVIYERYISGEIGIFCLAPQPHKLVHIEST